MYVEVNTERLTECLENWVETFNDCACCPLYPHCDERDIDCVECADKIKLWIED